MNIINRLVEGVKEKSKGLEGVYSVISYKEDVCIFGLQYVAVLSLIEEFSSQFFSRERHDVASEATEAGLSEEQLASYMDLHDIGYLPVKVKSLDEGTRCPAGIPFVTVENTKHEFAWLVSVVDKLLEEGLQLPVKAATESAKWFEMLAGFCNRTGGSPGKLGVHLASEENDDAIIADMARMLLFDAGEIPGYTAINHFYYGDEAKAEYVEHKLVEADELFSGNVAKLQSRPGEKVLLEMEAEGVTAASFDEDGNEVVIDTDGNEANCGLLTQLNHSVNAKGFKSVNDRLVVKASFDEAKALLERLEQGGWAADCVAFDIGESLAGQPVERGHGIARKEFDGQASGVYFCIAYRSGKLTSYEVPSAILENRSLAETIFEDGSLVKKSNFNSVKERILK